jgi:hypothetical protein
VVDIDLRTGKTLTATDVFRPETLTPTGIANLVDRMVARTPADRQDLAKVCFITRRAARTSIRVGPSRPIALSHRRCRRSSPRTG